MLIVSTAMCVVKDVHLRLEQITEKRGQNCKR
jgi:hypothetical protein